MKKVLFILAMLFSVQLLSAKDHVIVVRGSSTSIKGGHSVVNTPPELSNDTLEVIPGKDVNGIYVSVKNAEGETIEFISVSAQYDDLFHVVVPTLPQGYLIEIRDDHGVIYEEYKY